MDTIPKSDELLPLHVVRAEFVESRRSWFDVGGRMAIEVADVAPAVAAVLSDSHREIRSLS